jgi:hypothetical protein
MVYAAAAAAAAAVSSYNALGRLLRSDQPGRLCAVCVFAPWLLYRGIVHHDATIAGFSLLLFSWDLYWLFAKAPAVHPADQKK